MPGKIRAAILGFGRSGGSMHADALAGNDAFEAVAVCDREPAARDKAAERFGCAVYDDYHKMLADERPDLVVIVTRSDQHCGMTCDCLAAGSSVLVTKPWCLNEAEARRMIAAQERSGKQLLPWLPARWGADLRRLRELLAEQAVGKVFFVRRTVAAFGMRSDWQTQKTFGGGYLLNWGPHIVDPPVQLIGSPVRSVFGRLRQVINPGDVEDAFFAVLTLADGTIVQAEHAIALTDFPSWVVQGDRGTITIRGRELELKTNTPAQPTDPTQYAAMKAEDTKVHNETIEGNPYGDTAEVYAEIAAALRGERPFAVTPADALELTRTLDAIRASAAEDRVIEL